MTDNPSYRVRDGVPEMQMPDGSWIRIEAPKGVLVFRRHLSEPEIINAICKELERQVALLSRSAMPGLKIEHNAVHGGRFMRVDGLIDLHSLAKALVVAGEMPHG